MILAAQRGRVRGLAVRLTLVAGSQTVVQVLSAMSGLLIVRALSKQEYGQYTLAIAGLTIISTVSEAGFTASMLSIGGPVHNAPERLLALFTIARRRRLALTGIVAAVVLPGLAVLLLRNDASRLFIATSLLIVLFNAVLAVGVSACYVVLQIRGDLRRLQRIMLTSAASRLALLLTLLLLSVGPVVVLALNLAATALELFLARRALAVHLANKAALQDPTDGPRMRGNTRRLLPLTLFSVLQGSVLLLILGAQGRTEGLAEIAALNRYAIVFGVLAGTWSMVLIPAFAKAPSGSGLALRFGFTVTLYVVVSAAALLLIALSDQVLLGLLGPDYEALSFPLLLLMAGAALSNLGGVIAYLNQARGWLAYNWLSIPVTVAGISSGVLLFDLGTAAGAAGFSMWTSGVTATSNLVPTVVEYARPIRAARGAV